MNRPYISYSPPRGGSVDDRVNEAVGDDDYDYDEFDDYDDYPADRRWLWVAGVAGVILLVAVVGTVVILGGGDSGTVSTTLAPATSRPAVTPSAAPPAPTATSSPPAATSLPPETVTTVSPEPTASAARVGPAYRNRRRAICQAVVHSIEPGGRRLDRYCNRPGWDRPF